MHEMGGCQRIERNAPVGGGGGGNRIFGIMRGDDHVAIASKWFFIKIMKNISRYMISTFLLCSITGISLSKS